MALAQELLDHIIDYLHDDTQALCQCSLVRTSWARSTQAHLFRDIRIRPSMKQGALNFWLNESNHISHCVRSLVLDAYYQPEWAHDVISMLPIFPMVRELGLRGLDWIMLNENGKSAVSQYLPQLHSIAFSTVHFETLEQVLLILSATVALRRVCFIELRLDRLPKRSAAHPICTLPEIEQLVCVGHSERVRDTITHWFPTSRLEYVDIDGWGSETSIYLANIGASLRDVRIRYLRRRC